MLDLQLQLSQFNVKIYYRISIGEKKFEPMLITNYRKTKGIENNKYASKAGETTFQKNAAVVISKFFVVTNG